ncbi:hypothetical protein DHEL01_v205710 [Diaporthe helianthi]|uniref:Uncharacterized protein n=1 Tax=Diaporthe helianthi TaxID=158607 RepID=A0A2P5I061_DIAHE|nr:hypothetical protein DHEL01_v205710 [Diaporthe helianthi]
MPVTPKFEVSDKVKVCFEGNLYVAEVMKVVDGSLPWYRIKLTGVETRSEQGTLLGWLDLSGGLQYEVYESQLLSLNA